MVVVVENEEEVEEVEIEVGGCEVGWTPAGRK